MADAEGTAIMSSSGKLVAHTEEAKLTTALAVMQTVNLLLAARVKGRSWTKLDIDSAIDDAYMLLKAALDSITVEL